MTISWPAFEQTQRNLVQDFLDMFLPATYSYSIEKDYPTTASIGRLVKERSNDLIVPDKRLVRLDEMAEESELKDFSSKASDWAALFCFDMLQGFGDRLAVSIDGPAFEGLRKLATDFGLYLAYELSLLFHRYEMFTTLGDYFDDIVNGLRQIPAREWGEAIRESMTPAYVRSGETVAYELALLNNDLSKIKQSQAILCASEAELQREIDSMFAGYSTLQVGIVSKRIMTEAMSALKELFSNGEFGERFLGNLPMVGRASAWYMGRRIHLNFTYDPERTMRLLEAINTHGEITAIMEQYRCRHGWQGDRNKAVGLAWRAVAPKYFHLAPNLEKIKEDEHQEKLIGISEGLENYTEEKRAINALEEGLLGKLAKYLERAAENQEKDYLRKQDTEGNKALNSAVHTEEL